LGYIAGLTALVFVGIVVVVAFKALGINKDNVNDVFRVN
jgi:hypothetical protein